MSQQVLEKFYKAFQAHDAKTMASCYHKEVIFNDPAFKNLSFEEVSAMWEMLISRSNGDLKIDFHSIISDQEMAQCTWEAEYSFSKTGNDVHNIIHATMKFKDDLIIEHTDDFNFWRWSKMALGMPGRLLGWTPMLKSKVEKMAMSSLKHYMAKSQ